MSDRPAIQATFRGVRGSIATPGPGTVRYGGNTPCIEVWVGDRLVIMDAGTGIRSLGADLDTRGGPVEADLFFTHLHWDHIQGFPYFKPAFKAGNHLRIWGQVRPEGQKVHDALDRQMTDPNFPVPISVMSARLDFNEIQPGTVVPVGEARVLTRALNHPGGCMGLRVEHQNRSLVFCTDTEHKPEGGPPDEAVLALADSADVLIYDATFTEAEYEQSFVGWGHSTYEEAIRVARAAGVRRLYFFHHDPAHDDAFLDARLAEARAATAGDALVVEMAREGETITL